VSIPPGSRVWSYSRDSGGDDQCVDDQIHAIERYCDDNHLIIARHFCDRARPGSTTAGRDQFQAMIHLARSSPPDLLPAGVVFWSLSRFARDYDDAQFYKADLRRHGLVLDSISDDIGDGPHSRLIEAVVDWKNEQFLQDLSRDVKRGLHDLAAQGYAPGGFPPRGYIVQRVQIGTNNDGKPRLASQWIPDPDLAPLVRQAWEMRAQGATMREIHEATRIFGARNSYSSMFRNRTYLGIRKCGDLEVEDAHEAIVTWELWDAVQKTLYHRPSPGQSWPADQEHPRRKRSPFLLSGLARCGYCGSAMSGSHANLHNRPQPWPYYLCGKKKRRGWNSCPGQCVNARAVEAAVLDTVLDRVLTPAFVDALIQAVNETLNQDTATLDVQIEALEHQRADLEHAMRNLLDAIEQYGAESAAPRLKAREAKCHQVEQELQVLHTRREQSRLEVSQDVIHAILRDTKKNLASEDVLARREVLRQFVTKVELKNDEGRLHYAFPLDQLDPTCLWLVPPRLLELKTRPLLFTW